MAITQGIVFIHPKDFERILKSDPAPVSYCVYPLPDGLDVKELGGVIYRLTDKVPAILE